MFRISTIDTPQERRLVVEGTLKNPWVTELRKAWGDAGASLESRQLVIDLSNATSIDAEGEDAILELMKDGARFCCSGVLNNHVLKQVAQRCHSQRHNARSQKRGKESSSKGEGA